MTRSWRQSDATFQIIDAFIFAHEYSRRDSRSEVPSREARRPSVVQPPARPVPLARPRHPIMRGAAALQPHHSGASLPGRPPRRADGSSLTGAGQPQRAAAPLGAACPAALQSSPPVSTRAQSAAAFTPLSPATASARHQRPWRPRHQRPWRRRRSAVLVRAVADVESFDGGGGGHGLLFVPRLLLHDHMPLVVTGLAARPALRHRVVLCRANRRNHQLI